MEPASRSFFSFFFCRFEIERGEKNPHSSLLESGSSAHLPDDASNDDFSACLKIHIEDRSMAGCMDIYVQNKQAGIELVWDVISLHSLTREGRGPDRVGTLRSDNGDVHENVAEKQTSHHFKLFHDYPNSPCYFKRGGFWLKLREGNALKFGQRW